jgi:DNA-binding transcriptional MerR regulator
MAGLTVGRVAARAGVKIDTVRYYERRGVLPVAERRTSGYRTFHPQAVERIVFVKELQALGFTLDEIVDLLRLVDSEAATCAAALPQVEVTLQRVEAKIAALTAMRDRLAAVLRQCNRGGCSLEEVTPQVRMAPTPAKRSLRVVD